MNKFIKDQLINTKGISIRNNGDIISIDDITEDMVTFEIEPVDEDLTRIELNKPYLFEFEGYLVKPGPNFKFHAQWNNNNPIPLKFMEGTIDRRLNLLVHATLRGSLNNNSYLCSRCLKAGKYSVICEDCKQALHLNNLDDIMYIT